MKNKNLLLAFAVFITLLSFNSCKKGQKDLTPSDKEKSTTDVLSYIKSLGYRDSDIKDIGKDYLVDGDILFSKDVPVEKKANNSSKLSVNQFGSQNYLGLNTNVVVRVDPSMNGYTSEINSAIAQWNNVPNCRVKFSIYNGTGSYNTTISSAVLTGPPGTIVCGASYFPMNGQPGNTVYINTGAIGGNSFDQRQRTITHEFGHIIGLAHTNYNTIGDLSTGATGNGAKYYVTNLLGTPTGGGDSNSLMNGGECGSGATVLSAYDKVAIQFIYPQNPPVAGTSPVFRYHNINNGDHFYTTNYSELGDGNNDVYIFEGVGFFAYTSQAAGTVPVYRYNNTNNGDHYYSRSSTTPGNYHFELIAFYAYASALNGSVPVYRYNNTSNGDHFYTKNQNEFWLTMSGYFFEDNPFYVY